MTLKYGINSKEAYLALSGGFALNCPINTRLLVNFNKKLLAPPCVNDSGISLGMGLWNFYTDNASFSFSLKNAYWGKKCSDNEVCDSISSIKFKPFISKVTRYVAEEVVEDLIKEPIVWVNGRAEIGPRALGARSLLGDPRDIKTKDVLNEIKRRQWWRPVAPIVIEERVCEWFEDAYATKYMLNTFSLRQDKIELVPAIRHLDGSARVQTLNRDDNEVLYDILVKFFKKTGVPMLCNTSLNDKGEPIINTVDEKMNIDITDKVILITGGARGIGRHLAITLAREGASVIINYNSSKNKAERLMEIIGKYNQKCMIIQGDVSNEEDVKNIYEIVNAKYKRIDLLINNAGISSDKLIVEMSAEKWKKVIDTNLTGSFLCSKEYAKLMLKETSGKILNIASIRGLEGNATQSNYAASKAGMIALTKTLAISIGYLLFTNIWLGLVAVIMTPIMAYSIQYFTTKLKERYQMIQSERGLVDAWILEMMTGISQWKILNANIKVRNDYLSKTKHIIGEEIKVGYLELRSANINEALTLIGQLCVFFVAALCISRGSMTAGQFVACATYFSTCATYYNSLGKKITDISSNIVGIKRVKDFMTWKEEQDLSTACDRFIRDGNISFSDVSFGYGEEIVLKNLNLQIGANEKVVFVGKSGEGKSTILQLLCRFYKPTCGKICIDDIPIEEYTLSSIRSQIAVVQQENGLFSGSLRKNIIFSDDRTNDDRIWEILKGLKLKEIVDEFPEGLDTIVGSGGRELSGGQKQRIAIARCIFRRPKVLLLDEATSALDTETEQAVNSFVNEQLPETTILSVAHRFSTVLSAEKIIIMEDGRVTDIGRHETLIQRNALYQFLYSEYEKDATDTE